MAWRGRFWVLAAALWASAVPGRGTALAAAPSFDCGAAQAPIEILICGDDELAKVDADLADLYRRLLAPLDGAARADFQSRQRTWLKSRFAVCNIPAAKGAKPADPAKASACLLGLYLNRLNALPVLAANGAPSQPQATDQSAANQTAPVAAPIQESLPTALGLDRTDFPATGAQSTILSVARFGRYSVAVKSAQGVALQLVDRMTGPSEIEGAAGSADGRIDAFLDRGHYKILLHASEKGSGQAILSIHPFAELNGPDIPRLPEIKRIDVALDDLQQRSYWLEITQRRVVAIEAAGRNLADMRLWRDGNWLVDAAPMETELEPEPGKPLAFRRIVTTLEPGLYLLSLYGGPGETWAKTSDEHPLHLRMGIPIIADAGRRTFTASPFGIDRYLVPATANFFRLELPEAEAAEISVGDYKEATPFDLGDSSSISKQTLPPVAEVSDSSEDQGYKLVTVTREAGKPYILQHFQSVREYRFGGGGDYWLSTLHSGFGEDNVDATGILTKAAMDYPERVIDSNAPELAAGATWSRRFNLLEPVTVYFNVTQAGSYVVEGSGAKAEYRFEPMIHLGVDYKAPEFQPSDYRWKLEPGYYILTGRPKDGGKGILTLRVADANAAGAGNGGQAKETAVTFPKLSLDGGFRYTLYLNEQPGVRAGAVLRRLPIDLRQGLPVTLKAGQSLDVPVTAPGGGAVTAIAEDAKPMAFAIDHGAPMMQWRGDGSEHVLTLTNAADKALTCALTFTPDSLAPNAPLPTVSPETLAAIPNFPALVPQQPAYFDIAKDELHTFALDVAEPGLYRVESTGLLQTQGAIRTRTVVSLDTEANNGTGRNFLVQQYLGQGSYQLSVGAQGETHGHMGVAAKRTLLMDGGVLSPGILARNTIAAGNGLLYTFTIPADGHYRLRSLGLGRTFNMRLEDQDGWPIIAPNAPADYDGLLAAGSYRLVILPQPVDAKILTLLEHVEEPAPPRGHGPHDLALNAPQDFQWQEPEPGAERVPDQWRFRLTAPAHVAIDLSRGMRADLVAEQGGAPRATITGGETWKGELPTGSYMLRATTLEPNNRFDYTVSVTADELMAGLSRPVDLPADIPLSIGSDAVLEIGSFGVTDVRAWLYDDHGRLVATNDDRPNDWNFAIAGRMQPGFYRLHVEGVGTDEGHIALSVYQAEEQPEPPLAVGGDVQLSGPKVHIVPLQSALGEVLVASADANGPAIGLGIEVKEQAGAWRTLAENTGRSPWVAVPVADNKGDYRLRVWSIDRSTDPIRLQTRMVMLQAAHAANSAEAVDKAGFDVPLQPVPGIQPPLGIAEVAIGVPGAFRLQQRLPDVAWSGEPGRALAGDPSGIVFGGRGNLWFGARLPGNTASIKATRMILGEDPVALTVPGSGDTPTIMTDPVSTIGEPQLWLLESRLGQPGIDTESGPFAVAPGSAVTMSTGGNDFTLRLWNAGDKAAPLPAMLRRFSFPEPRQEILGWGSVDRGIAAHHALAFKLSNTPKRLQLALPRQTAVVLQGKYKEMIWSGDQPLAITEDTLADSMLILSAGNEDAHLGITQLPIAKNNATAVLGGGSIFMQYFASAGVVRTFVGLSKAEQQNVGKDNGPHLSLAGAVKSVQVLRDDGTVSTAPDAALGRGNTVDITHGVGLVVAWVAGGDPLDEPKTQPIRIDGNFVTPLSGTGQRINVTAHSPQFLNLKTTIPVLVQLGSDLRVFPDGADLNLYLPKGTTPITLRAIAGTLSGTAEATLSDIVPIQEGLGPKARLAPGESRLYSFEVKDERDIGVGVRGSVDTAHCRVLDAVGKEIGAGVVQMLHLKAGTYLLAVDAPADGNAIEVQPALVGIAAPDGSPPDDVKREYLEMAGLKPKQQE